MRSRNALPHWSTEGRSDPAGQLQLKIRDAREVNLPVWTFGEIGTLGIAVGGYCVAGVVGKFITRREYGELPYHAIALYDYSLSVFLPHHPLPGLDGYGERGVIPYGDVVKEGVRLLRRCLHVRRIDHILNDDVESGQFYWFGVHARGVA